MKSLPSDGAGSSSRKRAKPREIKVSLVAHDLKSKPRTEDVTLSQEDTDKDFSSLMLSEPVLKGLKESGFVRPSPIQLAAIPNAKIGLDMIVQAKSGTGKTCVYVVTALEMLKRDLPGLQVLVLAPTREIAMQGLEVASQIGAHMPGIKIASFIGGLPVIEDKMKATSCQMAIGTPGRVKQLLTEKVLNADTIRLVILDEADKLLEQSFLTETTAILDMLPSSKQVMTLSATYPDNLAALAENLMRSPQHIRLAQANQVLHGVKQFVQILESSPSQPKQNQIKQAALLKILSSIPYNQCLVFTNYQIVAQSTADYLNSRGFPSICISAGQDQLRRLQSIQTFKTFKCRILCSTDLTARGIDAENVNLVINYDIPEDHNTYLHRIGRGGRFGSSSNAVSLAPRGRDEKRLRRIVSLTSSDIKIISDDSIPKNLRDVDLPLLEANEEEIESIENAGDNEVKDASIDNGVKETGSKKNNSGKIKRRGKKKKSQNDNNENDEISEQKIIAKEVLNKDAIENVLRINKESLPKFENVEDLANKIKSNMMLSDPKFNAVCEVQKIADKIVSNHQPDSSFDQELKKSKDHLGYRTVKEILDFVSSNKSLPEHFKPDTKDQFEDNEENVNEVSSDENDPEDSVKDHPKNIVNQKNDDFNDNDDENESSEESLDESDTSDNSSSSSSSSDSDSSDSESSSDSDSSPQQYQNQLQYLQQQQHLYRQQMHQQLQQQQQLIGGQPAAAARYSEAQLREWYANVAAQSHQIELLAYQRSVESLRQAFGKNSKQ